MIRSRRLLPLFMAATFCLPVAAFGQPASGSHLTDLEGELPPDFTRLLDLRRGKRTNPNDELLRQLLDKMPRVDPKKFDEKSIKQFLNNDAIQKLLKDNPNLRDPENLQRLLKDLNDRENLERLLQDPRVNPNDARRNLEKVLKNLGNLPDVPKPDRRGKPAKPPSEPPIGRPDRLQELPRPAPKNDAQLDEISRWALRQFGDSPATHDMMKDFVKLMGEGELGRDAAGLLKDIEQDWKSVFGSTNDQASTGKVGEWTNGLRLPDLSPPSFDGSGWRGPTIDADTRGRSPGGSWADGIGGSGTGLLLVALLVLLGFFCWQRFIRRRPAGDEDQAGKRLAWPIEPHAIASRADVVKAFDFLSLARCGEEAANWHHRQIARQLSGQEPAKGEAVVRLAGLYEKARYAPASDLFSDTEIAEARARLSQIAGAASA